MGPVPQRQPGLFKIEELVASTPGPGAHETGPLE